MIEFTDSHKSWMIDNYGIVSRKDCAQHFHVSLTTIDRWAKMLGLSIRKSIKKSISVINDAGNDVEVEKGYCVDCEHYVLGGQCGINGKPTGALNEKPCFK